MNLVPRTRSLGSLDTTLRDQWLDLTGRASVDLSMAPQWFESAVESSGFVERAYTFTLHDAERLVGLIPYIVGTEQSAGFAARSRQSPGSVLVAYHPEIISLIEPETVLEMYLQDAGRDCDVVVLPNVQKGGRSATAAHAVAQKLRITSIEHAGHASPYLTISGDWECFLASRNRKFRYNLRARQRSLEEAGPVTDRWFSSRAEVDELVADILRIEEGSWKAGAGMAIGASQRESQYYRLLLPFIAERRALYANVLYLGTNPIAYSLCYISAGCVRQLKTSFDDRYARLGPGILCQQTAIRKAFETGAREFDFLGDVMPHKIVWSNGVREHVTVYLFLRTWRGITVGGARRIARWLRCRLGPGRTAGVPIAAVRGAAVSRS